MFGHHVSYEVHKKQVYEIKRKVKVHLEYDQVVDVNAKLTCAKEVELRVLQYLKLLPR